MSTTARPGPADGTAAAIEVTNATVALDGRVIWRDLSFEVEPGQFVAILGPNGAGKTTLVRTLLGQIEPVDGVVRLFGRPPRQSRDLIGYLPQRRHFDATTRLRGVDIVRLGLDGDRMGVPLPWGRKAAEARTRVAAVLERVGATPYAGRPIGNLSGGEQQRLLIAQALVREPRMLLLDEPLDSLDLPNQVAVAALLRELSRVDGVTIVMVVHDVNPILSYLDCVVYLANGTGLCGAPSEVITSARLTALFGTPIEVLRAGDGRLVIVGEPEAPARHVDRHAG